MNTTEHDHAGVIAPPPLIYSGALAVGMGLHKLVPLPVLPRSLARPLGWLLIGLSAAPGLSAPAILLRSKTALLPHHSTTMIVSTGPFKYTRNPIYLSFTLLYTGITATVNSLWPALLLPVVLVVMQRGVIEREERYLERKFGAEYTQYKARVRRWI